MRSECRADTVNRLFLIGAVCDGRVDLECLKRACLRAAADNALQIILRKDRVNLSRRIMEIIPEISIVTVRVEDERALSRHLFKTVCIDPCLLASCLGADGGFLCLDDCERFVVPAIEHIVGETLARGAWHPNHRHLTHTVHIERPSHRLEIKVDDRAACLVLRLDMRDIAAFCGILRAEPCQLLLQAFHLVHESLALGRLRLKFSSQTRQFLCGYTLLRVVCQERLVKRAILIGRTIAIVDEQNELEQIL